MDTLERAVVKREPQRRRWPVGEKCRIVEQTLQPGASVARVALAHGVNANQVFCWRRQYRQGLLSQRNAEQRLSQGKNPLCTGYLVLLGVRPASTANCSNSASTSGRAASADTWCAAASHRLRLGAHSSRIMPSNWSRSTFSRCPRSVSRYFTCFWCWPMTDVAFCTQCDRPPDRGVDRTATAGGLSLCPTPALPAARPRCD